MLRIFKYLKPYRYSVILLILLTLAQILSQLYLPMLMAKVVDGGVSNGDMGYIAKTGAVMLGFAVIVAACTVFARLIAARTSVSVSKDLRRNIFVNVEEFSLHEFDQIGTSSLITRSTNDVTQIQNVLVMLLTMFIMAPLTAFGGIIMALRTDIQLSWVILASVLVLMTIIGLVASKGIPLFKLFQTKLDKINLVLRESLVGIRIIRAFNREDYEDQRFKEANMDLTNNSIKVYRIMSVFMPSIMIVMNLTTIAIIWFGSHRVDMQTLQIGEMMAFQQYAMQIMFSLIMGAMLFVMWPRASASAERIFEVLDMENEIIDPEVPTNADAKKGYVEFKDVSFRYKGAEKPVLHNISFSAKPGQTTAIIGSTGSGKTTLVNLIPRFYDATSGEVIVDEVNTKDQLRADVRSKVGFVPQKISLFSGTIRENIMYGKKDASDQEIIHALKTAQAYEFISELDDGLDSKVEQDGANYSGGQRQRLCIARALLRKPEVYIFDDSFSALDFKTDAKLRSHLASETSDATVIIVAQRISTVRNADCIIVLDEGEIVGKGKHEHLLKTCDVYKEIVSSQLSKEEIS